MLDEANKNRGFTTNITSSDKFNVKNIIIRLYIIRIKPIIKIPTIYLSQSIPHIIPSLMK